MKSRAEKVLRRAEQVLPPAEVTKKLLRQLGWFGAGALLSRAEIFGACTPFSAALAAVSPKGSLLPVLLGSLLGLMLFPVSSGRLQSLAALAIVAAVRWTLSEWKKLSAHPLFGAVLAFGAVAGTGFFVNRGRILASVPPLMILAEGLLAGGASWFLGRTLKIRQERRSLYGLDLQSMAGLAVSGGIFLLAFASVTVAGISLGNILAMLVVLFCAAYGSVGGGCISGTACGMMMSLAGGAAGYFPISYAFSGLVAGCFSPLGRFGSTAIFVLANGVAVLAVTTAPITALYETLLATALFLLIPQQWLENAARPFFAAPPADPSADALRRSVVMRLEFASRAIAQVSQSVEELSRKLLKKGKSTVTGVYDCAVEETCRTCGFRLMCWEKNYSDTMAVLNGLTAPLQARGYVCRNDFPEPFRSNCARINQLAATITAAYEDFHAGEAAERRISEIRAVVGSQFLGVSEMLRDLAADYRDKSLFDRETAQQIEQFLCRHGFDTADVSCRQEQSGRMTVEIVTGAEKGLPDKAALQRELSRLCGRRFGPAVFSSAGNTLRIVLNERPSLSVITGCAQHVCAGASLCGDHYEFFSDGAGGAVAALSDGMGSGGRAAVDSTMACGILSRLVSAGIGYDAALRIVNSSLYIKSGDESLATLDVFRLDLYSGRAEFMKAGAPAAFLRRGSRVTRVDLASLPAGILQEVKFARGAAQLSPGDLVLMVSDGAVSDGDGWLEELVRSWKGTPQELCDRVVAEAESRRRDGHDDDITAAAICVAAA
ncbi:MAG: SpoIIE family protein phosphatase [Firmicutes bacterium]|nr:SpoIIE family protein phosphatase [Bacillota bacterium]